MSTETAQTFLPASLPDHFDGVKENSIALRQLSGLLGRVRLDDASRAAIDSAYDRARHAAGMYQNDEMGCLFFDSTLSTSTGKRIYIGLSQRDEDWSLDCTLRRSPDSDEPVGELLLPEPEEDAAAEPISAAELTKLSTVLGRVERFLSSLKSRDLSTSERDTLNSFFSTTFDQYLPSPTLLRQSLEANPSIRADMLKTLERINASMQECHLDTDSVERMIQLVQTVHPEDAPAPEASSAPKRSTLEQQISQLFQKRNEAQPAAETEAEASVSLRAEIDALLKQRSHTAPAPDKAEDEAVSNVVELPSDAVESVSDVVESEEQPFDLEQELNDLILIVEALKSPDHSEADRQETLRHICDERIPALIDSVFQNLTAVHTDDVVQRLTYVTRIRDLADALDALNQDATDLMQLSHLVRQKAPAPVLETFDPGDALTALSKRLDGLGYDSSTMDVEPELRQIENRQIPALIASLFRDADALRQDMEAHSALWLNYLTLLDTILKSMRSLHMDTAALALTDKQLQRLLRPFLPEWWLDQAEETDAADFDHGDALLKMLDHLCDLLYWSRGMDIEQELHSVEYEQIPALIDSFFRDEDALRQNMAEQTFLWNECYFDLLNSIVHAMKKLDMDATSMESAIRRLHTQLQPFLPEGLSFPLAEKIGQLEKELSQIRDTLASDPTPKGDVRLKLYHIRCLFVPALLHYVTRNPAAVRQELPAGSFELTAVLLDCERIISVLRTLEQDFAIKDMKRLCDRIHSLEETDVAPMEDAPTLTRADATPAEDDPTLTRADDASEGLDDLLAEFDALDQSLRALRDYDPALVDLRQELQEVNALLNAALEPLLASPEQLRQALKPGTPDLTALIQRFDSILSSLQALNLPVEGLARLREVVLEIDASQVDHVSVEMIDSSDPSEEFSTSVSTPVENPVIPSGAGDNSTKVVETPVESEQNSPELPPEKPVQAPVSTPTVDTSRPPQSLREVSFPGAMKGKLVVLLGLGKKGTPLPQEELDALAADYDQNRLNADRLVRSQSERGFYYFRLGRKNHAGNPIVLALAPNLGRKRDVDGSVYPWFVKRVNAVWPPEENAPAEPKPQPVEPKPQPAEPKPQPAEPKPQPVEPKPQPVEPKPQPVEPKPQPVEPKPQPVAPAKPDPDKPPVTMTEQQISFPRSQQGILARLLNGDGSAELLSAEQLAEFRSSYDAAVAGGQLSYDPAHDCYCFPLTLAAQDGSALSATLKRNAKPGFAPWYISFLKKERSQVIRPGDRLVSFAYLGDKQEFLQALAEHAEPEQWSFRRKEGDYSILWNYIRYTFYRIESEDKIVFDDAGRYAAFDTGLLSRRFGEPLYAVFEPNQPEFKCKWRFSCFCSTFQEGTPQERNMATKLSVKPQMPSYFANIYDTIFDPDADMQINYEHIFRDNLDRFPIHWVHSMCDGWPRTQEIMRQIDAVNAQITEQKKLTELSDAPIPPALQRRRSELFQQLGEAVTDTTDEEMCTLCDNMIYALRGCIDKTLMRSRRNHQLAEPCFFPTRNVMSMLLPIRLYRSGAPDLALVLERQKSSVYIGRTVITMAMAYKNARLLRRFTSDWLNSAVIGDDDMEEE